MNMKRLFLVLFLSILMLVPSGTNRALGTQDQIELVSLRDENAKIYQLSDGSMKAEVFADRIHYPGDGGILQEISNRIIEDECVIQDRPYSFRNEANDIIIRMAQDTSQNRYPIYMKWNDIEVMIGFEGNDSRGDLNYKLPEVMNGRINDNAFIVYPEVGPNVDYMYEARSTGVKESLIIKEFSTEEFSFIYHVNGASLVSTEDGAALVNASGEIVEEIGKFCAYDSLERVTQDVECDVEKLGDGDYRLRVRIDSEWMNDPERAFPVILDPSVTVSGYSYTYDACICSIYPNTNYCNDENLRSGYDTDYGQRRSLLRFYFNSNVSAISGSSVTSATLKVYKHSGAAPNMYAYKVNSSWDSSTVTWNNRPYYSDSYVSSVSQHIGNNWYSMSITSMVSGWLSGSLYNYGVELIDNNENNTDNMHWSTFYSSEGSSTYCPILTINYTQSPAPTTKKAYFYYNSNSGIPTNDPNISVMYNSLSGWNSSYSGSMSASTIRSNIANANIMHIESHGYVDGGYISCYSGKLAANCTDTSTIKALSSLYGSGSCSNVDLIFFAGCDTAKTSSDYGDLDNYAKYTMGVKSTVAFNSSVYYTTGNPDVGLPYFVTRFYTYIKMGYSVSTAGSLAFDDVYEVDGWACGLNSRVVFGGSTVIN